MNTGSQTISVELKGRDRLEASLNPDGTWSVTGIGCSQILKLIKEFKSKQSDAKLWMLPTGNGHADILVRELILKIQGKWKFPLEQLELCHCRVIATEVVDQAIIAGAHTLEQVRRWTSANTACGTCKPEIETLFKFRLYRGGSP